MKTFVKRTVLMLLALILILSVSAAFSTRSVYAYDTKSISGEVDASELDGADHVILSGDATITLKDGDDISVNCIRLNSNTLTIKGSNNGVIRVTGNSSGYSPIQMSGGSDPSVLNIEGGHVIVGSRTLDFGGYMIGTGGHIDMTGGILEVFGNSTQSYSGLTAVYAEELRMSGNAVLNVDVSCTGSASAVNVSNLVLTGGIMQLNTYSSGSGSYSTGLGTSSSVDGHWSINDAEITINADGVSGVYGYGISTIFKEYSGGSEIVIGGDTVMNVFGSHMGIDAGDDDDIKIAGNARVNSTAKTGAALRSYGDVTIADNAVFTGYTEQAGASNTVWQNFGTVYIRGSLALDGCSIIEPEGGYLATSGTHLYCIVENGYLRNYIVIAPNSNSNALAASSIYVNGGKYFSDTKRYYVNGASATTDSADNWNARYEPETGTLYLRDYNGNSIGVSYSSRNKKLTVDLTGTNTINKGAQFGLVADWNDLEITSTIRGSLAITGSSTDGAAIAVQWQADRENSVIISGDASVYIETYSGEETRGISAGKDIIVKDHAKLDINLGYDSAEESYTFSHGLMLYGDLIITTDQFVNVSMERLSGWDGEEIYAYTLSMFNRNPIIVCNAEYVSFSMVDEIGASTRLLSNYGQADTIRDILDKNGCFGLYKGFRKTTGDTDALYLGQDYEEGGDIPVTGAFFPDISFRHYIADEYACNGWLTTYDLHDINEIQYDNADPYVYSAVGIEYFDSLTSLGLSSNSLRTLDLSKLDKLQYLYCSWNQLTSLDVSHTNTLLGIECSHNKLSSLTLGTQPNIFALLCFDNVIEKLDLSKCDLLRYVYENVTPTYSEPGGQYTYEMYQHPNGESQGLLVIDKGQNVVSTAPVAPVISSLTNGGTNVGIKVNWDAGTYYTKFQVQRKATGESNWTTLTSTATGSSYTDKTAKTGGMTYTYRVRGYYNKWYGYSSEASIVRNPFTDVKNSASYFKALMWAYNNGIVAGTSTTKFSPNDYCTRGQFALMLWRMNGKPDTTGLPNPFKDVSSSNGFYNGIVWCYSQGITAGTSATTYSPNDNIKRWQMILMFWRMQGKPASSLTENPFTDVKTTASYYKAALWAYEKGITGVKTFMPNDLCTRWQLVLFLYRLNNLYHYI